MDLLATVAQFLGGAVTLARDVGKGGGGSTEEPTVCMTLLPVALGVAYVSLQSLRRWWGRRRSDGLSASAEA